MRIYISILFLFFICSNLIGQQTSDTNTLHVNKIFIAGNNITKEKVINRELLFKVGDKIPAPNLKEIITKSEESLLNTSLFNFVTIKTTKLGNKIDVYVIVEERWYIWPFPIIEHADRNLSSFLKEGDWSKINYGIMLEVNNVRGMNEYLKLKLRGGYKEQIQITYEIPYLTKNKKHGLKTEFSYYKRNEIEYNTINDKLVFYKSENGFAHKYFDSKVTYKYRIKHYSHHNFTIGYYSGLTQDTVLLLNPNYHDRNSTKQEYISLEYAFTQNKTDAHYYPLTGHSLEVSLSQYGIGLLENEMTGITTMSGSAYKYINLSGRWYSGVGLNGKVSSNFKQPYFIEQALGYKTYLRAYEYNVIGGQSYITTRSFLKYAVIPQKTIHIEQWKWRRFNKIHYAFYTNIFFETGYVYDKQPNPLNELPNSFLASGGIGIDLATYYDMVFRLEYSINISGYHGLFIHLKKAF